MCRTGPGRWGVWVGGGGILKRRGYNFNVTGPAAHSSFEGSGEAGDCQGETLALE